MWTKTTSEIAKCDQCKQNIPLFRPTSSFGMTKITTPIWLQKIMKMCEQI